MASTTMLNLYTSWDRYEKNDHISFDEDQSVSLSSFRRLPPAEETPITPVEKESPPTKTYCVEIKNASYTYGKGRKAVSAMKDISIKVPQGEM